MDQWVRWFHSKYDEYLSLMPRYQVWWCVLMIGEEVLDGFTRAHWPVSLAYVASSRPERLSQK